VNQYTAKTEVLESKDVYTISSNLICLGAILFDKWHKLEKPAFCWLFCLFLKT